VFNWLVRRLNDTMACKGPPQAQGQQGQGQQGQASRVWGFMGVLDIYGFEAFEVGHSTTRASTPQ
jgi:myosin heavy subunit